MTDHHMSRAGLTRRSLLVTGLGAGTAFALGHSFWRSALAAPAQPATGPYGPLGSPDSNGISLPDGFSAREIARGNQPIVGSEQSAPHVRPIFADGQATFPTGDGGYILVTNSEVPMTPPLPGSENFGIPSLPDLIGVLEGDAQQGAGAAAIRFDADASILDAYRILGGTDTNCAGGPTPWGTWLSCEEVERGHVFECDPRGVEAAIELPALGTFNHEAAAVDPAGKRVYLTEDDGAGGFYRFTPDTYPDLSSGRLEIATVNGDGSVDWTEVPDPDATTTPTREQVGGATEFQRGEGIWFDSGVVYVATTSDGVVHAYNTATRTIDRIYDAGVLTDPPLTGVDNLTVSSFGDIYVAEDNGESELDIGLITPERTVSRFARVSGAQHTEGELTGPVFDPTGSRLYFSSQRAAVFGITYEVSGPFRAAQSDPGGEGPDDDGGDDLGMEEFEREARFTG